MAEKEIWKSIPNFDMYEISDNCRLRSYCKGGSKILKPAYDKDGYVKYTLFKDGKRHYKRGHALVLETFVGPRPHKNQACHNDGDNRNNNLSNLRWDSQSNNELDKAIHGTSARGAGGGNSKLREWEVLMIRSLATQNFTHSELGKMFGISNVHAGRIVREETWKSIKEGELTV